MELFATCLGSVARQQLSQDQAGLLWGRTSRGAFIHTQSDWVFFLSYESYRGPLSLNLAGDSSSLESLTPGMPVEIRAGNLHFQSAGIRIDTTGACVWGAPPRPGTALPRNEQRARLAMVAGSLIARRKVSEISSVLPLLFEPGQELERHPDWPKLERVQEALISGESPRLVTALEPLLGLGTGLTPSGDDLVMGLLLALNRWGEPQQTPVNTGDLNQRIVPSARQKTTALSANLIHCAALGEADERLVAALDGILSGEPDVSACVSHLLSWGNSSGGDALLGIALASLAG